MFFSQFRIDVIDQLLKKLEDLVEILQQLESFRYGFKNRNGLI